MHNTPTINLLRSKEWLSVPSGYKYNIVKSLETAHMHKVLALESDEPVQENLEKADESRVIAIRLIHKVMDNEPGSRNFKNKKDTPDYQEKFNKILEAAEQQAVQQYLAGRSAEEMSLS